VSARTGVPLDRTVQAYLASDDDAKVEIGMLYVRRVFALLFLQFTAIGMILSPFCLIDSLQHVIQSRFVEITLDVVSFVGLCGSVYAVAFHGHEKWAARVGLFGGTFWFAVALATKVAPTLWAKYALVAVGQATVNFAILHALSQFDNRRVLQFFHVYGGVFLCFAMACLWTLLMREARCSWLVATTVPLAGWLFAMHILRSARKSLLHREPHDYLRAVVFILGPTIPDCLFTYLPRSARGRWAALRAQIHLQSALADIRRREQQKQQGDEEEGLTSSVKDYGAVKTTV